MKTFYSKHILPRLINCAMSQPEARRLREAWIPQARGIVLEPGIGSGLNLEWYSRSRVERVLGVDPSVELQRMARQRAATVPVEFLTQSAELPLPLDSASVDTVILTWTLCSIADPFRALREMKRVLKPDGKLIFIEHGKSADRTVAALQNGITPVWKRLTGGCHLNRRIDELLTGAGFQLSDFSKAYVPGPRPMTFTYQGIAR